MLSFLVFPFPKGIAPITVVTHRDTLDTEEECKDALEEASAATGSSVSHTFFVTNYTKDNKDRNPEIEKMAFDILHYALMTAERAVKIMKQKEKNKQEDEMMKALEGVTVSGQVAPDSKDGNLYFFCLFVSIITNVCSVQTFEVNYVIFWQASPTFSYRAIQSESNTLFY